LAAAARVAAPGPQGAVTNPPNVLPRLGTRNSGPPCKQKRRFNVESPTGYRHDDASIGKSHPKQPRPLCF
jgi:hypothetical protein